MSEIACYPSSSFVFNSLNINTFDDETELRVIIFVVFSGAGMRSLPLDSIKRESAAFLELFRETSFYSGYKLGILNILSESVFTSKLFLIFLVSLSAQHLFVLIRSSLAFEM